FAAYQADVRAVVPFLEVPGRNGQWTRVADDIGFPAGLARTMVADLSGRLPPGASRIRIGTNLKIYWDQILVSTTPQTLPTEVRLEFDPSRLPALGRGWSRDYFLYADGFAKEMDFYAALSGTVEPLPFHSMGQYPYGPGIRYPADPLHLAYRLGLNTRNVNGYETSSYRFRYSRP